MSISLLPLSSTLRLPLSIRTCLSDPFAKIPEQNGRWNSNHSTHQRKDSIAPSIVERVIHVWSKHGECETRNAAQADRGRQSGCRKSLIGVDDVNYRRLQTEHGADAEKEDSKVRDEPESMYLGAPAEPEKTNWNEE